jgi:hypothetical protein
LGGLAGKEAAARSIIFRLDRIQSLKWDNGPVFHVAVLAQNVSNQSFTVNSIAGNAYSDGYLIGNVSLFGNPQTIQPNSEQELMIKVKLSLINAVTELINSFEYAHVKKELSIDAMANVDSLVISIKQKIMVGG